MLIDGLNLMAVGMVTVFSFLALLVLVLNLSAHLFASFGDRWSAPVPTGTGADARATGSEVEVAVMLAAIDAHRARRAHRRRG